MRQLPRQVGAVADAALVEHAAPLVRWPTADVMLTALSWWRRAEDDIAARIVVVRRWPEMSRDGIHQRLVCVQWEMLGYFQAGDQAALGDRFEPAYMSKWETDGCSLVDGREHQVTMVEIEKTFKLLKVGNIDLMLMNIEGYEYTLLPHMLERGIQPKRLMVQFHTFVDQYGMALAHIHAALERYGYRIVWTYGVMLTAWERV